jgi:hypothetical protein
MIRKLFFYGKSVCRVYAHVIINALFPFSICWSIGIIQQAFKFNSLSDKLIYLGLAILPLYCWRLIYIYCIDQKSKLFVFRNITNNNICFFGLVSITVTILSVVRDLFLINNKNLDMIPAGIIGKYFNYLFQPDSFSFSNLSFWLLLRYFLVIISFYPYVTNIHNIFDLKPLIKYQNYNIKTEKSNNYRNQETYIQSDNADPNNNNTNNKNKKSKSSRNRRGKKYGKKITYIE